jgi:acyl-CoA reductase-like NAD-dependent aldehyde dehydrogenase
MSLSVAVIPGHPDVVSGAFELVREFHGGVVQVKTETAGAEPQASLGGVNAPSSHPREQGNAAGESYTRVKTVYVDTPA